MSDNKDTLLIRRSKETDEEGYIGVLGDAGQFSQHKVQDINTRLTIRGTERTCTYGIYRWQVVLT